MLIALTGGIGCGKSTAATLFADLGWKVLDADAICHHIYETRSDELITLFEKRWGQGSVSVGTRIDRKRVASIVFADEDELDWLNSVFHPKIREYFQRSIVTAENVLCDIPLLYETGWQCDFDAVMAVWSPAEQQHARLVGRGWSDEDIAQRLANQISADEKLERADYGLVNNGDMINLKQQCIRLDKQLRTM